VDTQAAVAGFLRDGRPGRANLPMLGQAEDSDMVSRAALVNMAVERVGVDGGAIDGCVSSPSELAEDMWPDSAGFEANADGRLTLGQRQMLLGGSTSPPYLALAIVAIVAVGGAALWWRFGFEVGITVVLIGSNIGLVAMGVSLEPRSRRRRLRSDLGHPRIGGGIGEVAAAAGQVDIRCGTGLIGLGPAAPNPPAAGWYQMYWLEHPSAGRWNAGRVLLSARRIPQPLASGGDRDHVGGGFDARVVAEVRAWLREVLRRTEWEFGFNRRAELSPPQRYDLHRRARGRLGARLAGVGVGTATALLFLVAALAAWLRSPSDDQDAMIGGFIGAALGLVAAGLTVRAALQLPAAVAAVSSLPPLLWASGPVRATLTDGENNVWTVAVDGGPTFSVTADVARAFRTQMLYTVYYVLRARECVLLAAEPSPGEYDGAFDAARGWPRPDWVTANAAGRLTPAQQSQIVGEPIRRQRSTYMLVTPALVVLVAAAVPYISHHYQPQRMAIGDGTELIVTMSVAAAALTAWAVLMVWRIAARHRRSAVVREPAIVTSTGEVVWAGGKYQIRGSPVRLRLPPGDVLPEPGPYRFYWLPRPKPTLLSAEPHQTERHQTERHQTERHQTERHQTERHQTERHQTEPSP
jgi:hypothetical protein